MQAPCRAAWGASAGGRDGGAAGGANIRQGEMAPADRLLKFEHAVVLVLTALISIIIVSAIWKLAIKILYARVLFDTFDLTDLAAFQSVFGMIFTVIIALEFKRTLLLVTERT